MSLSVKDMTRKVLVKLVQTYDLTMLKKHLGKNDLESLEEIEQKYVQKKYDSKFAKKMKSEMPELIIAEQATPQNLFMFNSEASMASKPLI